MSGATYIDVTLPLAPGTPEWPGDTPYSCGWTMTLAAGESVNLSTITMSPHVGTHADAPLHVRDGWPASDALVLDAFVGPAVVVDVSDAASDLSLDDLTARLTRLGVRPGDVERVLLRTGRSIADGTFPEDWPCLTVDCTASLVAGGLRLLGVDAPSVDRRVSTTLVVHRALFGGGAFNLENLDLRDVQPGVYELLSLPLRIVGLDAAPARAVLRRA